MNRIITFLLIAVVLLGTGVVIGYTKARSSVQESRISANTIVQELQQEGFLVTQSMFVQEQVSIEKTTGSAIKDLFLGQTINASALLHIDVGVDLQKLAVEDVTITDTGITIQVPAPVVRSVSLRGPITLENKQGIVKRLFDNDDGYNDAIALFDEKGKQVLTNEDIRTAAEENTIRQIQRFVSLLSDTAEVRVIIQS